MLSHRQPSYGADGSLLTRAQVAERLGVSPRTVARLVACGQLPCVRIGRLARFRPVDVAGFVERALAKDGRPSAIPGAAATSGGQS